MLRVIRRPVLMLVVVVAFLAVSYMAYKQVGSGFMPHMDEGGFVLDFLCGSNPCHGRPSTR